MFVSHTLPTVRKRCDSKYFLGDLWRLFFFFLLPEVPILFQNLCSELVYTFKWTKSVAWLWRNQICEWTLKKKKSPYLPTHLGEMEGQVQETNISLRGPSHEECTLCVPCGILFFGFFNSVLPCLLPIGQKKNIIQSDILLTFSPACHSKQFSCPNQQTLTKCH